MHLASGKDIELKPLKLLKEEERLSKKALVAMDSIEAHNDKMECYTCHATWAPQCYGCHVKIDYSGGKQNVDYVKMSHDQDIHGTTGGMRKSLKKYLVDGKVTETRSFLRWEDPMLGQNGEGRVTPLVPGCQVTVTVIGKDGKALLQNHIFKVPNAEGAGEEGQNAIDMSPIQPHTIQKEARSCESCHASKKALGFGIDGTYDPSQTTIVDIMTADGKILPKNIDEQIPGIKNLKYDYSKILDENGTQLMTVGSHFKLSGPLNKAQRDKLDRSGICLTCHQDIPEGNLAVSAMVHLAEMAEVNIDNKMHKDIVNKTLNVTAWIQIIIGILGGIFVVYLIYFMFFKKKPYNPRNEGWK